MTNRSFLRRYRAHNSPAGGGKSREVSRKKPQARHLETLEKRELLAAEMVNAIYAPNTPEDVVQQWEERLGPSSVPNGAAASTSPILTPFRWTDGAIDSSTARATP